MKIKILAVLAVVTVVTVSMFMREKREDPSSLMMMNVEALATGRALHLLCVLVMVQWFVPMMDPKYYIIGNKNHEILSDISLSFGNLYRVHFRFAERSDVVCFFS